MDNEIVGQGSNQTPSPDSAQVDASAYSPEAYQQAANLMRDANPQEFGQAEPNPNQQQSSFFKRLFTTGIFGGIGQIASHPIESTRVGFHAVGEAAKNIGTTVIHATDPHTYGITRDPTALTSWWDQTAQPAVEDAITRLYGEAPETGPEAFLHGAVQFSTGMKLVGGLLSVPGRISQALASGAVADFSAFDPHEKWLMNAIANGPEWFGRPVARFLAINENDSEIVARLKHSVEGALGGAIFEGIQSGIRNFKELYYGLRAVLPDTKAAVMAYQIRALRTRMALEAGTVTDRQAAIQSIVADLGEADRLSTRPAPGDAVVSVPTTEGQTAVVPVSELPNGQIPKTVAASDNMPVFDSPAQADAYTSSVNTKAQNSQLPPGLIDTTDPLAEATLTRRGMDPAQIERQNLAARNAKEQARHNQLSQHLRENPLPPLEAPPGAPPPPDPALAEALRMGDHATVDRIMAERHGRDYTAPPTPSEPTQPSGPTARLTPEAQAEWKKYADRLASGEDAMEVLKDFSDNSSINFNYVQDPQEVMASVRALAEALPPELNSRGRAIQTHEQTMALAADLSKDTPPEQWVAHAQQVFGNTERLPQQMFAMRSWLMKLGKKTYDLSQAADAFPDNAVAQQNLADALDTMAALHDNVRGTSSNVARALNQQQIDVNAGSVPEGAAASTAETVGHRAPSATGRVTAGRTRAEIRAMARQVYLSQGDPAEILAAINTPRSVVPRRVRPVTWFDRINTYRMEAMLSGPRTHVINAISNAVAMFQRPTEYWWAGVRTNNPELKQMGADMLAGIFDNYRESWNGAKKAFWSGQNQLDPGRLVTEDLKGASEWSQQSWLQRVVHAPSRMLLTSDEFFAQMNYRNNLRSQILRQAREAGITDPQELATRLHDQMPFGFSKAGQGIDPIALQYSRVGTFKNDLEFGIGKWLQEGAQNHPVIRVIFPFVRTPTNLFRYSWERTPMLGRFSRIVQADLSAGGERAAIARAKLEMGGAVWSTAAILAYTGVITGRGPSDPELRKQWREAGHQPYSINTPLGQISYRRADPTLSAFGVVADVMQMAGDMKEGDLGRIFYSTIASIAANITSKTYMQGLSQFLDAASSGDWANVRNALYGNVASFVPNVLNQTNPDHYQREVRDLVDVVASRVPGTSLLLEPRRNLFGEKVMKAPGYVNNTFNPFTVMAPNKKEDVADAILSLGRAFTMPPEKIAGGAIDLTDRHAFDEGSAHPGQSPYDRWMELMGQSIGDMPPVRQQLEDLVQTEAYKTASAGNDVAVGGLKYRLASAIIQAHKAAAWGTLLNEYPALVNALVQSRVNVSAGLVGDSQSPSVNDTQQLLTP